MLNSNIFVYRLKFNLITDLAQTSVQNIVIFNELLNLAVLAKRTPKK